MEFLHHFLALLLLLLPTCSLSEESSKRSLAIDADKLISSKILYEIKVHGFLLWASMGLLLPMGILFIRMSNKDQCPRLLYFHITSQMGMVILTTTAAIMSIRNFDNSFNNYHQRIGVGLYVVIWFQALLGFFRPARGDKGRRAWFVAHWLMGISVGVLGMINIYTGLNAYTKRTSRSVKLWTILFTIQLSCIAFFYLLQEKLSPLPNQNNSICLTHQNNFSTAGHDFRDITTAPEKC